MPSTLLPPAGISRPIFSLTAVLAAIVLGGCSTVSSRINEKSGVFAALSSADQSELRHGVILQGYTPDLVYIALGKPTYVGHHDNFVSWHYLGFFPASLRGNKPNTVIFDRNGKVGTIYFRSPPEASPPESQGDIFRSYDRNNPITGDQPPPPDLNNFVSGPSH